MENSELPGKAYQRVLQYVRDEILKGSYRPGKRLPPERELAEKMCVSRNSVREAMRTLEIIGVIKSTQGAGNYVSCHFESSLVDWLTMMFLIQQLDYRQVSELRQGIEFQAALLAMNRISDDQMFRLEELVEKMRQEQVEEENVALDKQFHSLVAQASGNQLFVSILQALSDVMDLFISDLRRKILTEASHRDLLQQAHEGIVRGIRKKDKALIAESVQKHFRLIQCHL